MLLKKTSTSLMSTKLIVFGALFAREILRVDSPVSNIIYVPHVRPPRLPWLKCRDIYLWHNIWRDLKKKATVRPLSYCIYCFALTYVLCKFISVAFAYLILLSYLNPSGNGVVHGVLISTSRCMVRWHEDTRGIIVHLDKVNILKYNFKESFMFISRQTSKTETEGQTKNNDNWPHRKRCCDPLEESQSLQNK